MKQSNQNESPNSWPSGSVTSTQAYGMRQIAKTGIRITTGDPMPIGLAACGITILRLVPCQKKISCFIVDTFFSFLF